MAFSSTNDLNIILSNINTSNKLQKPLIKDMDDPEIVEGLGLDGELDEMEEIEAVKDPEALEDREALEESERVDDPEVLEEPEVVVEAKVLEGPEPVVVVGQRKREKDDENAIMALETRSVFFLPNNRIRVDQFSSSKG